MNRTLYHGSKERIVKPLFGAGKRGNDYGRGFYCTESEELAMEWAVGMDHDGWANVYSMKDDGLNVLDLNSEPYCLLHWLAVLLNYREFDTLTPMAYQARDYIRTAFAVDHRDCDCIIGWRADNISIVWHIFPRPQATWYNEEQSAGKRSGV